MSAPPTGTTSSAASTYFRPLPVPPSRSTTTSPTLEQQHQHQQPSPAVATPRPPSILGEANTATTSLVPASQVAAAGEPIVCNACKLGLEETLDSTVVSFGKYLFHVDCRCAKCHVECEHNTNLLLLSDGSPVCENCAYICSVCQTPIHNEAIVTGDESYHADCFRCRSCQNKIEELIFAKTTQGIWCMSCHNERVARTRKHAEAKQSRSARKDKESSSRSSRSRADRERERSERSERSDRHQQSSAPPTQTTFDIPSAVSASGAYDHAQPRPLPPSPHGHSPSTSTDLNSTSTSSHRRPREGPGRSHLGNGPEGMSASSSTQSLSSLAPRNTSSSAHGSSSLSHHRTASAQFAAAEDRDKERIPSPSALRGEFASTRRTSSESTHGSRPNTGDESARAASPRGHPPSNRPHAPSNLSPSVGVDGGPTSPTFAPSEPSSRQGSLSAPTPVDKSMNRRSGFYGAMSNRPSIDEGVAVSAGEERGRQSPAPGDDGGDDDLEEAEPTRPPHTTTSSSSSVPLSFLPELHNSVSFYDPDTLLFLDHVGSTPNSPKRSSVPTSVSGRLSADHRRYSQDQLEHLSPELGGREHDDDDDEEDDGGEAEGSLRREPPKSEVARRVRESIQISRQSGGASGSGGVGGPSLDVELVELLLTELEGTKREMKELQGKYNAFRRASRSAFEGFSMARDEYDKEVAARRDAEARMDVLRAKFVEQAQRLAAIDQQQKAAEVLKRQSKELKSSVVGMEKHLSTLKAEVELTTAQAAELAAVESVGDADGARSSVSTSGADLVQALNARLETVKDAHRHEIKDLIAQRDELEREVDGLRSTRDLFIEETTALNLRNTSLAEKNVEATRQLDTLRESISKLRMLGGSTPSSRSHQHSASSSSLQAGLPPVTTRSPLATSRGTPSPNHAPTSSELDQLHRFTKPEAAEPHSVKKFKWGKASKAEPPRAPPTLVQPSTGPTSLPSKTPVPGRSGSADAGPPRPHAFQQTSILRPVRCDYCGDKMWGLNEVRCTACGSYAHAKCAGYLQSSCSTASHANGQGHDDTVTLISQAPAMFGNDLTAQVKAEDRQVPLVVSKCIAAVEAYGMTYEGIYRKTGGMGQTKLITQFFERGQDFDLEDLDKFNDLAAITSCLKNFFRCLPVPLFTHELHEEFVRCSEMPEGEPRLVALEQTLYKLPEPHFYTARMLIRHLHRVHLSSNENKMTPANLGVVFGPTVLRSSIASREWTDMGSKSRCVEILVEHAPRLWTKPYPGGS